MSETSEIELLRQVDFLAMLDDTNDRLRRVYATSNGLTLPISGTGSAGMEASFVNFLRPGDPVVVGVNGVFGERMCEVASRLGAEVVRDCRGVGMGKTGVRAQTAAPSANRTAINSRGANARIAERMWTFPRRPTRVLSASCAGRVEEIGGRKLESSALPQAATFVVAEIAPTQT